MLLWMIKLPFKATNFLLSGGYIDGIAPYGTPEFIAIKTTEEAIEVKKPYMGKSIVDDGGDAFMGGLTGIGGMNIGGWELFTFYDPHEPDSVKGINNLLDDMSAHGAKRGWGRGHSREWGVMTLTKEERRMILSNTEFPSSNFFRYQWKVKQALDPNDVGDFGYGYLDET